MGQIVDERAKRTDAAGRSGLERLRIVAELADDPQVDPWTRLNLAELTRSIDRLRRRLREIDERLGRRPE